MMKKRVLAVLLAVGVCAAMSGCAKNEKPMSPDQVESTSSTESSNSESGSGGSSSVGSSSEVSVSDDTSSSFGGESSANSDIPPIPEGTTSRSIVVNGKVFTLGWSFQEIEENGWYMTTMGNRMVNPHESSDFINFQKYLDDTRMYVASVQVVVYNNAPINAVPELSCQIVKVSSSAEDASVGDSNSRVRVGMTKNEAEAAFQGLEKMNEMLYEDFGLGYMAYWSEDKNTVYSFQYDLDTFVIDRVNIVIPTEGGEFLA